MRPKLKSILLALLFGTALGGCNNSGTWSDDPKNFYRAWSIDPPPDVKVVHSLYWRSPHFTREEAYYFQFAPNEKLVEAFVANNSLKQAQAWDRKLCIEPPAWFAAGLASNYEAWSCPEYRQCVLLRDRKTLELYFAGCQI